MRKIGVERRVYTSGEVEGDPRPVPAGKAGGRGAAEGDPGRGARPLHRDRAHAPRRRAGEGPRRATSSPASSGRARRRSRSASPTAPATSRSVLREKFGDKVRLKLFSTERSFFGRRGVGIGGAIGAALRRAAARGARRARRSGTATGSRRSTMPQLSSSAPSLVGGWYRLEGAEARDGARRPRGRGGAQAARPRRWSRTRRRGATRPKDKE